jgi:uncharacterized repeat protein (TIGR01451 family)
MPPFRVRRMALRLATILFAALPLFGVEVTVVKTVDSDVAAPGTNVTYTIFVQNAGPAAAVNVHLSDPLPFHTTFVSFSGPGNWSCSTPSVGGTGVVSCDTASLAEGVDQFTLVVKVDDDLSIGTPFTNTATITADNDGETTDNSDSVTVVSAVNDLELVKTDGPDPVSAGGNLTYGFGITQRGFLPAENAEWSDTLPAGVTFVSLTRSSGEEFTCTTPAVGAGGTITCSIDSFGGLGHNSSNYYLTVHVDPSLTPGTVLSNTATITSDTPDADESNNSATVQTTVAAPSANLSVTKQANPPYAWIGSDVTFQITVTNNGPSDANGVVVDDTLPAGLQFVSATPSQGSCNAVSPIHCTIGSLVNGASATVTVVATVSSLPVTNTATVDADEADPSTANNSASATISIWSVPTVTGAGLALMALLLAAVAAFVLRR